MPVYYKTPIRCQKKDGSVWAMRESLELDGWVFTNPELINEPRNLTPRDAVALGDKVYLIFLEAERNS